MFLERLQDIKTLLSNNEDIDRFFLFVLSHGSEKGVTMCESDGVKLEFLDGRPQSIDVDEITSFFDHSNIPSLKGYPKCIFIQSCRGSKLTQVAANAEASDVNPKNMMFFTTKDCYGSIS